MTSIESERIRHLEAEVDRLHSEVGRLRAEVEEAQARAAEVAGDVLFRLIFQQAVSRGHVHEGEREMWSTMHRLDPEGAVEALERDWGLAA
jgi:hypothetical protein